MPCGSFDDDRVSEMGKELVRLEAMLCAVLTAAEKIPVFDSLLEAVDWEEAGIQKRTLLAWWRRHKKEDRARKRREKWEKKRKRVAKRALSKLTLEEQEALGH